MKLAENVSVVPEMKKIARYLLTSDVRKHHRFCPCC